MQITSLIGTKTYQKQGFLQNGIRVPLTGVVVEGNVVTQIKTTEKDGYSAIQVGIGSNKKAGKRDLNHSKKAGLENAARFFKEIKVDDLEGATLGAKLNVADIFTPGDIVDVTGTSKGKGWAGGVKRWGFKGGPRTHGQSDRERAPGSIGQTTTPGRVYRGKKMAGRMGTETVTVKNLEVIEITADGVLLIKGLVPGALNSLVVVKKVDTNKNFVPLFKEEIEAPAAEAVVETQEVAPEVAVEAQAPAPTEEPVVSETEAVEAQDADTAADKKEEVDNANS